MLLGMKATEWKKAVLEASHPHMNQTVRMASVTFPGHLEEQTQASLPGRDLAEAAIRCPVLQMLFLILPSYYLGSHGQPV